MTKQIAKRLSEMFGNSEPYSFLFDASKSGGLDWILWLESLSPKGNKYPIFQGMSSNYDFFEAAAVLAALKEVAKHRDWRARLYLTTRIPYGAIIVLVSGRELYGEGASELEAFALAMIAAAEEDE